MTTITYYFSLLSPFTYLAGDRLEQIAARHGAQIDYRPVDFLSILPQTGGLPVPKRHPARQAYRLQELKRLSAWSGLPLNLTPAHWPTDSVKASSAVIAVAEGGGDAGALARAFLRACWAEERDIGDAATISAILSELGHDPASLEEAMVKAADTYRELTEAALAAEVFGAPFYIVGDERFWGQDRLDMLDWHLGRQT